MMRRYLLLALLLGVAMLAVAAGAGGPGRAGAPPRRGRPVQRRPHIRPDYADSVIPPNIAPLNFCIAEPGIRYHVKVHSARGQSIEVRSQEPAVQIPLGPWKRLLAQNRGEQLRFDVYVQGADDSWQAFETITNAIAHEEIDPYLVYRGMNVIYNWYSKMRIYERNVEDYGRRLILDNQSFDGCMNCHTFLNNSAQKMILHVRSGWEDYGVGMLLIEGDRVSKVNTRTTFNPRPAAFASWHPSGRALAFSTNKVQQFFHSADAEVREGTDLVSDLAVYVVDSRRVITTEAISAPDRLETWPAWSADGRYLYYCNAPLLWPPEADTPPPHYNEVKYDLMRIGYEAATASWGQPEVVLSAEQVGSSITLPRASPDGRFLLFCLSDYGSFPAFDKEADIYLMDLQTGQRRRLECSSDQSDSWHAWSSNSRWITFSSKRGDGLFMKAYFAHIDEDGHAAKAFVLPQREPDFYDSFIRIYHLPELVLDPVPVAGEDLARAVRNAPWIAVPDAVTGPTPAADRSAPWEPGPP